MSDHCRHMRADVEACCQFLASLVPTVEKSLRSNKFTVGATAPEYSLGSLERGLAPSVCSAPAVGGQGFFCAGVRRWHQRDSGDARHAVVATGPIAFRLAGSAWRPAHEKHQPDFPRRRESSSTAFSAALVRHRLTPCPPAATSIGHPRTPLDISFFAQRLRCGFAWPSPLTPICRRYHVSRAAITLARPYISGVHQKAFWEISIATE